MNFSVFVAFISLVVSSLGPLAAHAQNAAPVAVAQEDDKAVLASARELMDVMQKRLDDTPAAIKRGELEPYFDFKALTLAPIAAHNKALNKKQRAQLERIFAQLVRQLAYASGAQFRDGKSRLSETVRRDASAHYLTDIKISHPDDDVDNDVSFVWAKQGSKFRVIDVTLDSASVEKDYENQFAKIIARDGADGLIKKMQARLNEAEHKVRKKDESGTKP